MGNGRKDFKREHFKDRQIGKFQQNVQESLRKSGNETSSRLEALENVEEAVSNIVFTSVSATSGTGTRTIRTQSFDKIGGAVKLHLSISRVQTSGGTDTVRILKNGATLQSYNISGVAQTGYGCAFVFFDSVEETATVEYKVQVTSTTGITTGSGYVLIEEA